MCLSQVSFYRQLLLLVILLSFCLLQHLLYLCTSTISSGIKLPTPQSLLSNRQWTAGKTAQFSLEHFEKVDLSFRECLERHDLQRRRCCGEWWVWTLGLEAHGQAAWRTLEAITEVHFETQVHLAV